MYKNNKIIAIIPARSGSKGLKDKNIKELSGKPLIAHTIDAAIKSGVFDYILCSTDSKKYAQIAKQYNAEVPFLRSEQNSGDKAGSWDVVKEVLSKLDTKYDIVALLQPTSPLRTAQNIKDAVNMLIEKDANAVVSVCETQHPMFWCNTLPEDNSFKNFIKPEYQLPRQQLPKTYTINGAVYVVKTDYLNNLDLYSDNCFAYVMPKENSIDIDSELDFRLAELYLNK